MDYSPPSPPSPPTPDWEAIREAQRQAEEARQRKETYVRLILIGLDKFPNSDQFISFLALTLRSNMSLDKRYSIAQSLNTRMNNKNLDNETIRTETRGQLREDALNMESSLYRSLNYQRNIFAITFFGDMKGISCNYARTLQTVHAKLAEEVQIQENHATQSNTTSTLEMYKRV